jgi:sterol desaturase/sphingolipid hydroxylase (fatty acid hydroxylase superfamily)
MEMASLWWYVFTVAFVVTGLAETFLPIRPLPTSTARRWASNTILGAISSVTAILAYQASGIALAFSIRADSYGVLNQLPVPYAAKFAIGILALDLTSYGTHRLFHSVSKLWLVHRVHHSESELDLTTGLRFHPIETLAARALALTTVAVLGLPPGAVILSGLIVLAQDFFQHANARVPSSIDRALRLMIVTPGMHRMHHSEEIAEQNANFGTLFSIWDRLFGTYREVELAMVEQSRCGVAEIANGSRLNAVSLFFLPFRGQTSQKAENSGREALRIR